MDYKNFAIKCEPEVDEQVQALIDSGLFAGETLRLQADCHAGKGCVIGTCLTFSNLIVPNIVGVDIGCRVSAYNIGNVDIDFNKVEEAIRNNVPSGQSLRGSECALSKTFEYDKLYCWDSIKDGEDRFRRSMGTLGAGNHFISIEVDEEGDKWLIIHSGSRNLGYMVATVYQKVAIAERDRRINACRAVCDNLTKIYAKRGENDKVQICQQAKRDYIAQEPNDELCYITGGTLDGYLNDVSMLEDWSYLSHQTMAEAIVEALGYRIYDSVSSIHNYVDVANGIIRKGAISAYKDEVGIIPISPKDGSLIVIGKGNADYLFSAPHGAGRVMSRSEAKRNFTVEDYKNQMEGIYAPNVCAATLDESPIVYKDINDIVPAIQDTVYVVSITRPIFNYKAKG